MWTHVEAMSQVRRRDPEVIAPCWPIHRLARRARVERNDVEVSVQARIVHLCMEPIAVEEQGMEQDQGRLLGIEAADVERSRVGCVPYRRIVVGRHEIDVGHGSWVRALFEAGGGLDDAGIVTARVVHEQNEGKERQPSPHTRKPYQSTRSARRWLSSGQTRASGLITCC